MHALKNAKMEVLGWAQTEPIMIMRLKFTLRNGVEKEISKFQCWIYIDLNSLNYRT